MTEENMRIGRRRHLTAYYVAALLPSSQPRWGSGGAGSAATITYSFMTAAPSYASADDASGFAPMSTLQQAAVRSALAAWADVANVSFVEVADGGSTSNTATIRLGTNNQAGISAGYAYNPSSDPAGGDVYIANDYSPNANPVAGNYAFQTLVHELGHALGLKHPGNYDAGGGGTEGPYLPTAEDNRQYSVMSYYGAPSGYYAVEPSAPALYDVAAIQYLYGANLSVRTGADTYSFTNTTTAFTRVIWDGGGTDTIDASSQSRAVTINLQPGQFSSIGTNGLGGSATSNVAIAFDCTIENAVGGSGNDTITGNDADNTLDGGAGRNTLDGGNGNDVLIGNGGNDTLIGGAGTDIARLGSIGGFFWLSGMETILGGTGYDIAFTDNGGSTMVVSGTDILVGGTGRDVVTLAASGNAVLLRGLEVLTGGSGNDAVTIGDTGTTMTVSSLETLIGGAGADVIATTAAGSTMVISALEVLAGASGNDLAFTDAGGSTMAVSGIEILVGGISRDVVALGGSGNTVLLRGLEALSGSAGTDLVTIGDTGTTMMVSALETLVGGAGNDLVFTADGGSTMAASNLEILVGGSGLDIVTLSSASNTLLTRGVDRLTGGSGFDLITLGNTDNTMSVGAVELLTGGLGTDVIFLAGAGNTMTMSLVDILVGSSGTDVVQLSGAGSTLLTRGIETLIGSAGLDRVTLGDTGTTQTVSGVETLIGGAAADLVTVAAGPVSFEGRAGADVVVLATDGTADNIVFRTADDGGATGIAGGFDSITNFQTGTDHVQITGQLRAALDHNASGTLDATSRSGDVNLVSDELVTFTGALASLADPGFAALLAVLGHPLATAAGASLLILASNGRDSGLYVATDNSGAGTLTATDIRLLGIYNGTILTSSDIAFA